MFHQNHSPLSLMKSMFRSILDVPGIKVGHAQDFFSKTGATVILCTDGAVAGIDIRGSAAGTRQTDALSPSHSVSAVHAVLIVGGSAFGLDATGGVMRFLEERSVGYDVLVTKVPIVPSVVLFDLAFGSSSVRPDQNMGYEACLNASAIDVPEGSIGAGTGATVGKFFGIANAMKGGVGSWSEQLPDDITVGALAAVNAFGDIRSLEDGRIIAGARTAEDSTLFADTVRLFREGRKRNAFMVNNTTIGVVATTARLSKEEAGKVARICQNGLAKTASPAHTTFDGDTVIVLSMGNRECDLNGLCVTAESAFRTAVQRAVTHAHGFGLLPDFRDIEKHTSGSLTR